MKSFKRAMLRRVATPRGGRIPGGPRCGERIGARCGGARSVGLVDRRLFERLNETRHVLIAAVLRRDYRSAARAAFLRFLRRRSPNDATVRFRKFRARRAALFCASPSASHGSGDQRARNKRAQTVDDF